RRTRPGRTRPRARCRPGPGRGPATPGGWPGATAGRSCSSGCLRLRCVLLQRLDRLPRLELPAGEAGIVRGVAIGPEQRGAAGRSGEQERGRSSSSRAATTAGRPSAGEVLARLLELLLLDVLQQLVQLGIDRFLETGQLFLLLGGRLQRDLGGGRQDLP